MKKTNVFLILVITIIAIMSCSQDSSSENNIEANSISQRLSSSVIGDLQKEFLDIVLSSEYITLEDNIKEMSAALKKQKDAPLESRLDFQTWVTSNISETEFENVSDAMELYDRLVYSSNEVDKKYNSFYTELRGLELDEIELILEPELIYPDLETTGSPCQNACIDEVDADISLLDAGYAANMSSWNTHIKRTQARIQYYISMTYIVESFNHCMGGC